MYSKVLVPLDGSPRAEAILPHVIELARRCGTEVTLVQVIEMPHLRLTDPVDASLIYQEYDRRVQGARAYLADLRARLLEDEGVAAHYVVADGHVVDGIMEAAEQAEADLIALASHGRTGLAHVFYGSVALGLLHRADRPLLVVRAQD